VPISVTFAFGDACAGALEHFLAVCGQAVAEQSHKSALGGRWRSEPLGRLAWKIANGWGFFVTTTTMTLFASDENSARLCDTVLPT
jgi:hypothetical protein